MSSIHPILWKKGSLFLLDQRKLPFREEYLQVRSASEVFRAIRRMVVRGAPAIGVCAAFGLALQARRYRGRPENLPGVLRHWQQRLLQARPTAINLRNALCFMEGSLQALRKHSGRAGGVRKIARGLERAALQYFHRDLEANRALSRKGARRLQRLYGGRRLRILTLCNTGALATSGVGTAWGVIQELFRRTGRVEVYACETRPWLQGSRLTAWEAKKSGVPLTLIADGAAGFLLRQGQVDVVIVGADRITRGGDVANKIGTYALSVLARAHRIPFYVAAPSTTLDPAMGSGMKIPIEERSSRELTSIRGLSIAPVGTRAYNPVFDVTPASLVTGYMTEKGVFRSSQLAARFFPAGARPLRGSSQPHRSRDF
ncbi:MAG: S-methyl-5-thioribose-1-phosphate isomerase [Elusimicrobia bacterium]|nr:S-methyl-5-thioribose-1-phosphate isomerase [Elusimicrobiota bacterium]